MPPVQQWIDHIESASGAPIRTPGPLKIALGRRSRQNQRITTTYHFWTTSGKESQAESTMWQGIVAIVFPSSSSCARNIFIIAIIIFSFEIITVILGKERRMCFD